MKIPRIEAKDSPISVTDSVWMDISRTAVENDWKGELSPQTRRFEFQLAWDENFLHIRFTAKRVEECVLNPEPDRTSKTMGLWERDVCEIFVTPEHSNPNRYMEFEIAPTGEWVDLMIEISGDERNTFAECVTNARYEVACENGIDLMMISIPWTCLETVPRKGLKLRGNIFRCIGKEPNRGYLSLWATNTLTPNFHVPESFGEFTLTD